MITFKQFLAEEEAIDLKTMLTRDCAPFLNELKKKGLLYRGIKKIFKDKKRNAHGTVTSSGKNIDYIKKPVRQDRQPRDSFDLTHSMMDDWFEKKFGIKARSQTVFCTANPEGTKRYGQPFIIFPIGPIKYVWSPNVADIFYSIPQNFSEKEMNKALTRFKYTDKGLSKMVTTDNEIMIQCESYYAFPIEHEEEIKKVLGIQ